VLTDAETRQLDELGYLALPGLMSESYLAEVRRRVEELFAAEGAAAGSEFKQEPGARRLANLVNKGRVFEEAIVTPRVLDCMEHVLGPEFKLSSLNVRSADPGSGSGQPLHADSGAVAPPVVIEMDEAMAEALRRRPELKVLDADLAATRVQKQQDADLVKPQVNLVASYSLAGLAGTIRPGGGLLAQFAPGLAFPGSLAGGAGSSLSSLFAGNYQSVQAGIAFDFTARNRAARAGLAADAIAEKRLGLLRARAEQAIQAQLRNALQALETARQRMRAAAAGADAARDKLASESRLFAHGESTNFLVLTRQNEYSAARRRRVEADAAFNKAVSQYGASLGTTLASRRIEVE